MDYSLVVKRMRMQAVLNSIDGGNAPGTIELRNAEDIILAKLLLTRPSFYLVGDALQLAAPAVTYVQTAGVATKSTITDGSGNIVVEEMTVGVDETPGATNDFEVCLDNTNLEVGKQVTIVYATIEHG
jgi:hypothetical protein